MQKLLLLVLAVLTLSACNTVKGVGRTSKGGQAIENAAKDVQQNVMRRPAPASAGAVVSHSLMKAGASARKGIDDESIYHSDRFGLSRTAPMWIPTPSFPSSS